MASRQIGPRLLALSMIGLLAACGGSGGGGGGTPPPPPALLALLKAAMTGSAETTVVDAAARATAMVELHSDGTLNFAASGEAAWTGAVTGLHIHQGIVGTDGPIVVDLLGAGATFAPATHTAAGSLSIGAALASAIASAPGQYYVNVHTTAAPAGLARAQLEAFSGFEVHAFLRGDEEVLQLDPSARGAATLHVQSDLSVAHVLAMAQPPIADIESAHLHVGPAGVDGAIVVDLDVPSAALDVAAGTLTGTTSISLPILTRLCQDPAAFYVNAHTAAAPAGVARGQTSADTVELWAFLKGDKETIVVNPDARGGTTLQLFSFTQGRVHMATPPPGQAAAGEDITALIGAHVHVGAAGADGPIVIDLMAGADYTVSPVSGSAEGTVTLNQTLFTRMLAAPGAFYANFHTPAAPAGLVRGQLTRDPVLFSADLLGANETIVVDPGAMGTLTELRVHGVFEASFTIQMVSPPAADLIGGHIHDGVAGVDGPILIDLLGSPNLQVAGNVLSGDVIFTGRTFSRLMAFSEGFYCNVHSVLAPAGIARGQCMLVLSDLPPAGLTYTTPVVYATGAAITPNVPSSTGGAVTSYAISPPLPAGLSINTTTGVISGTPTATIAATNFTVTASNQAGSTQAIVNIQVVEGAPLTLVYTTPVTYVKDQAITPNVPSSTGGAITSYSVSPALPAGLSLNTTTGVISGTPTGTATAANYTVTGSNSGGSVNATVNIEVVEVLDPPSNLSYTSPVSYPTGVAISPNSPTVTGSVDSYSVSPALPAGLTLNTSTGVISGTPTSVTAAANYTVTASNAAGSTNFAVNITITVGAPTNLSYSNNPNIAYVSTAISSMNPSNDGGAITSYAVTSGSLPAGISLNTSTGVISGTPTQEENQTFTVTGSNSSGNTSVSVTIYVYP